MKESEENMKDYSHNLGIKKDFLNKNQNSAFIKGKHGAIYLHKNVNLFTIKKNKPHEQ